MAEALTVRAVERTLEILKQFSFERPAMGVTELAKATQMHKGTVYRLLLTLEQQGFVQKDPETQRYRLGLALFYLGSIVQASMDLRRMALPIMRILADQCRETVNLNIVSGHNRVCVECIETPRSIRAFVQVGMLGPLYRGASGKLLLAHLPTADRQAVLMGLLPDERLTLEDELTRIRRKGYATSSGNRLADAASVSAPILDYSGRAVAGLTISGPRTRFTDDVVNRFTQMVVDATGQISTQLGFRTQLGD